MTVTAIGRAALEAREGVKLLAYKDSVGVWTIGYGHTTAAGSPAVKAGMMISQEEADEIFARDLPKYEAAVDRAVKVPLADHERDALVSICYNIGQGGFAKSTFVKRLNAGDRAGCAEAIMSWSKPAAIISRREAERDQFLTPYDVRLPKARSNDARPVKGAVPGKVIRTPTAPKPAAPASAPVVVDAPRVNTVEPSGRAPGLWAALLSLMPWRKKAPGVPELVGSKGDKTIFYVQTRLRERAYYVRGIVDGLDGKLTQDAVASARETLGMSREGGIDAEFLARLPSLPQMPVSEARANIGIIAAARHAPEAGKPAAVLGGLGASLLGVAGLDVSGIVDTVQNTATQAGDVLGAVQSGIGMIGQGVAFVFAHRTLFMVLAGLWALWIAARSLLKIWIMVRQAFR